ncbi:MAG: DNA methyltransferase [Promethearchaeota archaeon]
MSINLNWQGKKDIFDNLNSLKKEYQNYFDIVKYSYFIENSYELRPNKWRNKLFWGDNFKVLCNLLNNFEGKIDLIYIDPPFYSGVNYKINIQENGKIYEDIAYFDCWNGNLDSYLQMLYECFILFRELLSEKGLLFVHLDWHASHYIRLILDEIFGSERFINNIVWYYYNKYSAGKKALPRAHDDILVYSKTDKYYLNEIRIPRDKPIKQLKRVSVNGVLKNAKDANGKVIYRIVKDKKIDDVWIIPCMQPASKEWTGYPTQKHHDLLKRIIELGSNENDLIADFFCGSGTTLVEAEKLNRKWIGCDISHYSIYLTIKRLLKIKNILNYNNNYLPSFELLTHLNDDHKKILDSGFFKKKIKIMRKK